MQNDVINTFCEMRGYIVDEFDHVGVDSEAAEHVRIVNGVSHTGLFGDVLSLLTFPIKFIVN